jgi:DNA-binding transcriptional MerR regulator
MKTHYVFIIIPIISALLFSGCSLKDIFSQLATTNQDPGLREQQVRNQILEAKQQRIADKQRQYTFSSQLTKVNESDPYDAYIFSSQTEGITKIELEAILPNSGRQIYELWLRNPATKEVISLGALQYNQTDDYSLLYSGTVDTTAISGVILTREANPDNQPETVILTGSLTTSTP